MEESASSAEVIASLGTCAHMLAMLFASIGGIYGALAARRAGAVGPGPQVVALGFGLMVVLAAWIMAFAVPPSSVFEFGTLRRSMLALGFLIDAIATAALIVGVLLLRAPTRSKDLR